MLKANFKLPKNEFNVDFELPKNEIKSTFNIKKVVPLEDLDFATNERVDNIVNDFTNDLDIIATELDNRYTKIEVDEKLNTLKIDAYTKNESDNKFGSKEDVNLNKNQIEVILDTIEDDKKIINKNFDSIAEEIEKTNNNLDALTGDVENIAGELDSKADKSEIPTIPTNISYFNNDSGYVDNTYHDNTKQDVINDLNDIRTNAQTGANLSTQVEANTSNISYLDGKVRDIELFKSPNVLIQGEPTINNGQVTGLSKTDYLILPFEFDVKDRAFELTYAFRTGNDVTIPQNLFGSKFSIASYVSSGKLTIRISNNGTSWDILDLITSLDIQANTTYYIKLIYNKLSYEVKSSADGVEYSQIGYKVDTRSPFAEDVFIGIGNNQNNPFLGMINLHKWELKYNNVVFWEGMDDAGLATRADISLSNLDEIGQAKFDEKQDVIEDLDTIRAGAKKGATALQTIPIAAANKVGGVAGGNWLTVNADTGKMECGELTKVQYDGALGYTFISKTTLENVLENYATKDYINSLDADGVSY